MKVSECILSLLCIFQADCNVNPARIGEGHRVDKATKFPFFVQLLIPIYPVEDITRDCGGALIHPEWIITAGHCFPAEKNATHWLLKQNRKLAFMGTISAVAYNHSNASSRALEKIIHHPHYVYEERLVGGAMVELIWNDIVLLKVTSPFKLSPVIKTIALDRMFDGHRQTGVLIGIGMIYINDLENLAQVVHYAVLPVRKIDELPFRLDHETNTTFYVVGLIADEGEISEGYGLPGDDGGPFIITKNKRPTLSGILSLFQPKIYEGWVVHAVERIDLVIGFISEHVIGIDVAEKLSQPRRFQRYSAVPGSGSRNSILFLDLLIVLKIVDLISCLVSTSIKVQIS